MSLLRIPEFTYIRFIPILEKIPMPKKKGTLWPMLLVYKRALLLTNKHFHFLNPYYIINSFPII